MKTLIATIALISSIAAFAGCKEKAMIKYMHQGYMWDVAAQMAHADCSTPTLANAEYYSLFNRYMGQGLSWDVAAQMAYSETHPAASGEEFVQLVVEYMGQGLSREVAVSKAYTDLN